MKRLRPRAGTKKFGSKIRLHALWIEAEHYDRLIEIMGYPEDMSRSYERWREKAEGLKRRLESKGHFVSRVVVEPDEFVAWCRAQDVAPDRSALDDFVHRSVV